MVFGFGSSDEEQETEKEPKGPSPSRSPTQEVKDLASQGYSEGEIVDELRDMGYPDQKIRRSINKVLKSKVSSSRGEADVARDSSGSQGSPRPPKNQQNRPSDNRFVAPEPSSPQSFGGNQDQESDSFDKFEDNKSGRNDVWEMTEEEEIELEILIEEIIDEKWVAVESDLEEFREERQELVRRIESLEEKVEDLQERHQEERERLEDKTDKTFDHVKTVESRVGSVEKAFKEFLPQLTENVRSLSGVVKDLEENAPRSSGSRSLNDKKLPDSPESYLDKSKERGTQVKEDSEEDEDESPSAIPG